MRSPVSRVLNMTKVRLLQGVFLILVFLTDIIDGVIQPLSSATPYVEVGDTLRFSCRTDLAMEWFRGGHVIKPTYQNNFELHTLKKEPQGIVESTLFKHNVMLNDRGGYVCRDALHENDFHFYATVIYISATAVYQGNGGNLRLTCHITAFESVVPRMRYEWLFRGKPTTADSRQNVTHFYGGLLHLDIIEPNQNDNGPYQCKFFFLGQVFSKPLDVEITDLPAASRSATLLASNHSSISWLLLFMVIVVLATSRPS